jgi:signal transduction histidine kinase
MRRARKNTIYLIIGFVVLNFAVYILTELNKDQRTKLALDAHIDSLKNHYEILLYNQKTTSELIYQSTIANTKAMNIFKEAYKVKGAKRNILRQRFYTQMLDKYERIKLKGVLQYQFLFPDNTSFIRMHKPNKYGDYLGDVRYSFQYANSVHKPISGFEQGRVAHGFRNVFPIFDDEQNHLGAVEISFSSDLFQDYLTNITKVYTHFLVKKDVFDVKTWARDDLLLKYKVSMENDKYMFLITDTVKSEESKAKKILSSSKIKQKMKEKMDFGEAFSLYSVDSFEDANVLTFYPIQNIKEEKTVAWLVSYEKNQFVFITIVGGYIIRFFAFVVLLILFYFAYRVLNQKDILDREVKLQTKELHIANKELQKHEKELQELNENLEQKVLDEVQKNQSIQNKLHKAEKMAAMGEMIGNIAHQWRQPLSVISTGVTGMMMQKEHDLLTDELFTKTCENINENAQYLSSTIDDFKNYIKGDNTKVLFNLKETIDSIMHLIEPTIKNYQIKVHLDLDSSLEIIGYSNELKQSLINIINNAKDILEDKNEDERFIFIKLYEENGKILISIKDSGGGINEKIKDKIFEPYFTTKHQSRGTGLGLHMVYDLIVSDMGGKIEVLNETFTHESKEYKGAKFILTFDK